MAVVGGRFSEIHRDGFHLTSRKVQFGRATFESPWWADLPTRDFEIELAGMNGDDGPRRIFGTPGRLQFRYGLLPLTHSNDNGDDDHGGDGREQEGCPRLVDANVA